MRHAPDDRTNSSTTSGPLLARPVTRRQVLQGGMALGAGLLAASCGSSAPTRNPQVSALARAATSPAPATLPSATPLVPTLSANLLRTALGDLPAGGTVTLPGGATAAYADLAAAAGAFAEADSTITDPVTNPIASLGFALACADRSGKTGRIDLSGVLPKLGIPLVRLELPKLPGSELTDTLIAAAPPGLVLRPGAALLAVAVLPDGRLVLGIADPARTVVGHLRLELALLAPATAAPLFEAAGATLEPSGVITIPGEPPIKVASVDPALTTRLATAAGVLFVDSVPLQPPQAAKPVLTDDPVVPGPATVAVSGTSRVSQADDGRVLALDAGGDPIGRAEYLGGAPGWDWVGTEWLDWSLRELADGFGLTMGVAALGNWIFNTAEYHALVRQQFNSMEVEAFHWLDTSPTASGYNFSGAESYVNLAARDAMRVEGHHLMWAQQLPTWLTAGNFSQGELLSICRSHVEAVVSHFAGRVNVWSVFNEAVSSRLYGGPPAHFWVDHFGPEYDALIAQSFAWARGADPKAALILNEQANDGRNQPVSEGFYQLVQDLLARKVPLDGVGMEMHLAYHDTSISGSWSPAIFASWVERYRALDLGVYVTEFDVDMTGFVGTKTQAQAWQAAYYRDYLQAALDAGVTSFNVFGLTDNTSWLVEQGDAKPDPLMFDSTYRPKPAYFAVRDVLKAELRKLGWRG